MYGAVHFVFMEHSKDVLIGFFKVSEKKTFHIAIQEFLPDDTDIPVYKTVYLLMAGEDMFWFKINNCSQDTFDSVAAAQKETEQDVKVLFGKTVGWTGITTPET